MIGEKTRAGLLALVRETIAHKLGIEYSIPAALQEALDDDPLVRERRGVFVTLHKQGALRGCIGYIEPVSALEDAIPEMALAAAFRDPRFPPLFPEEFLQIDIEISVLSPLFPLSDPGQVVVGTHGLVASRGARRGLLLPQVPVEQGWDRETFLRHVCLKAGLEPDALSRGASLEAFTATVFGEKDDLHSDA